MATHGRSFDAIFRPDPLTVGRKVESPGPRAWWKAADFERSVLWFRTWSLSVFRSTFQVQIRLRSCTPVHFSELWPAFWLSWHPLFTSEWGVHRHRVCVAVRRINRIPTFSRVKTEPLGQLASHLPTESAHYAINHSPKLSQFLRKSS